MTQLGFTMDDDRGRSLSRDRRIREKKRRREIKRRWYVRLRAAIRERYRGHEITTDEVWGLMAENPGLSVPSALSPNALGHLFVSWDRASWSEIEPYRTSKRRGAHSNRLKVWRID